MGPVADIASSLASAGYLVVFFVAMAESGLVVGLFLPGDTMLIAAGVLASQGYFNLPAMIMAAFLGAVIGDSIAYALGRRFGTRIFKRERPLFFNRAQIERSEKFYQRHGGKTIIIARFLPIVRAVAPILAGVGKMRYGTFISYNLIGGLLWTTSLELAGYLAGSRLAGIHNYLDAGIWIAATVIFIPPLIQMCLDKDRRLYVAYLAKKVLGKIPRA
jgi:membrane-associated protein